MLEASKQPEAYPKKRGSVVLEGYEEPKVDPINQAKLDVIYLIDHDWNKLGEWHKFTFEPSEDGLFWSRPHVKESLKSRLVNHYIRRSRRANVVWQYSKGQWAMFIRVT